jgi:DNA-binding winged helix-turn-helix (wHTH) protein/TolB-like protein/Flp pilus assembly protein TadD
MSGKNEQIYEFGAFRLNVEERFLQRDGETITLTPKVFDLLVLLVENHGHLLEKDEIIKVLWADSFVEEANLNVNISALRRALGETPTEQKFIETVPRRGYRFVSEVSEIKPENLPEKVEKNESNKVVTVTDFDSQEIPAHSKSSQPFSSKTLLFSLLGILTILAIGFFIWYSAKHAENEGNITQIKSIAVLPFKPLTKNGSDEALEMGMADTLITKLSGLQQITVRPTSSVLKYASLESDSLTVGRELKVDAVLEGKIQRAENKIRVTVQMLRTSDGATLWSDSFDDFFTNIFAVQDSIAEKVTASLATKISGKEKELLTKRPTENTEAYALYLKARFYHEQISEEGSRKAVEFYQAAIDKDPEYALAYAWRVGALIHLANLNINREENLQKARDSAAKAVSLDPNLADAHEALATVKDAIDWNFAESEIEHRKSIKLDPKNADAHFSYASFLSRFKNRQDEAIKEIETAKQLNPVAMYIQTQAVTILLRARRYDQAIAEAKKVIELNPDFQPTYYLLARLYIYKGMFAEANELLEKHKIDSNNQPYINAVVNLHTEKKAEAEKSLRELIGKYKDGDNCSNYARYYILLGDKEHTLEFLEKAFERREVSMLLLDTEPEWDEIRSEPRFQDLIRRVGLPD